MSDPLKLDVGCGGRGSRQPGCIGIDLCPRPEGRTAAQYVQMDFIKGPWPWLPNTVDEIICLHMIEHLVRRDGALLILRAVEFLKPGATMTITCPDLRRICQAYVDRDDAFLETKHLRGGKDIWPGETLADRVNWAIHQDGHLWAYDLDSLMLLAQHTVYESGMAATWGPLPPESRYNTRPGLEVGIVIRKEEA